jgi:hypothetical protein
MKRLLLVVLSMSLHTSTTFAARPDPSTIPNYYPTEESMVTEQVYFLLLHRRSMAPETPPTVRRPVTRPGYISIPCYDPMSWFYGPCGRKKPRR